MDDQVAIRRADLLETAVADVKKWCSPSNTIVSKTTRTKNGSVRTQKFAPDTFWIDLLDETSSIVITEGNARDFLVSFQLASRFVVWCNKCVADVMTRLRMTASFHAAVRVPLLADELRECCRQKTLQTSAASKIATFAKPRIRVFIWDRFARASVKRRDRLSGTRANSDSDYPAFYVACERALEHERRMPDFRTAVELLQREFLEGDGVMANRSKVPVEFIERRLLDKLMFQEGALLEFLAKMKRPDKAIYGARRPPL